MIRIKNPKQLNIFDPWDFLPPKRKQLLEQGWPKLFRDIILPSIPVNQVIKFFNNTFGRPTKELFSLLGALILQQSFDLTDEETVQQYAFNIQWHYALNITEESDEAKYLCSKTLWNARNLVTENNLESVIFEAGTKSLAEVFKVNTDQQRIDSVHIKSNMRRLGRIGIFSECIHKFLVNLKRRHPACIAEVDPKTVEKYLSEKALSCFSRIKPSESRKTLTEVSRDLFNLIQQFQTHAEVAAMYSFKLMQRILNEQCNLTDDKDNPVEIKAPKEIPSDSLQNPSDPDATYSGHKGQGYHVQIMETYHPHEPDDEQTLRPLNLITYVEVEQAHKSDAHALIPAIESAEAIDLKPTEVLADSLYNSDENQNQARKLGVEVVAPTMGAGKEGQLHLSDFEIAPSGRIQRCPQGHAPAKAKKKKRTSVGFAFGHCQDCPERSRCPVKKGKKFYYLRFTEKDLRIALRRQYEQSDEFQDRYRWRAGVEATMSEYDRRTGIKHLRVRGLKAMRYCAKLKALAINMFRAVAYSASQPTMEEALCA